MRCTPNISVWYAADANAPQEHRALRRAVTQARLPSGAEVVPRQRAPAAATAGSGGAVETEEPQQVRLKLRIRSREDVVWLAAFYEGEGCLFGGPKSHNKWLISIASTDKDVIESVRRRAGGGKIYGPYSRPSKAHHKPIYHWRLTTVPHVYALCAAMYQFLGKRRRAKIEQFFKAFKKMRPITRLRNSKGQYLPKAVTA